MSFISCSQKREINFPATDLSEAALIPKPLEVVPTNGGFPLDKHTIIRVEDTTEGFKEVADFLAKKIQSKTGLNIPVSQENKASSVINIRSERLKSENKEAYEIRITQDTIDLIAHTSKGAFWGVQTLRQLIPYSANDTLAHHKIWVVPTGTIKDAPQFSYRATMLDVSRHFFEADYIKEYISLLAYYKINVLHLHLTDDQGWRIEIKSWPKLTEVGGSTEVGGGPGGFYTQKQYKEIVAHAKSHHITIVPEVDMPGHTNAAIVSYPFLNGTDQTPELYTGKEVGFSTFDTRKDTVYAFIDDVVREITMLSPGPYFHVGGDESHVTKKEDYIYFINRVEKIVQKYGKQMIGWDEIANADLDSNSVAQFWWHTENIETAISKGMKTILSPANKTYLDMKYDSTTHIGYNWAGYIPVDSAYNWHPESYTITENILGIDAPLWSETISTTDELEYLAFPRLIGYAELGWTIQENRSWSDYKRRLALQAKFLEQMEVNYYRSPLIDWVQ
jgi:hexosaminidase